MASEFVVVERAALEAADNDLLARTVLAHSDRKHRADTFKDCEVETCRRSSETMAGLRAALAAEAVQGHCEGCDGTVARAFSSALGCADTPCPGIPTAPEGAERAAECCEPNAPVVPCSFCGKAITTCERPNDWEPDNPDRICPRHNAPEQHEMSGSRWVCSNECGLEIECADLNQRIFTLETAQPDVGVAGLCDHGHRWGACCPDGCGCLHPPDAGAGEPRP